MSDAQLLALPSPEGPTPAFSCSCLRGCSRGPLPPKLVARARGPSTCGRWAGVEQAPPPVPRRAARSS
eukprot:5234302-Pyramimonas_sp.AAC.1